jgi:hypothetical protein
MDDHLLGYITKPRKNREREKKKKDKKDKNLIHPQIPLQRTIEFIVSSQVLMRRVIDLPSKGGEDSCVNGIATSL